mmetsp:Transcript_32369/g.100161  ORF Transcript_32369/g.100161 Transcript_32369/m.100161 type:complete len:420 (+) Transcript_32369:1439-2698(+)
MSRHGGGRRRRLRAPVGGDHERHRGRSARAYRARRRGRHEALQGRLQDHRGGGAVRRQGALRIPRPPADDRPAALRHEANHRQPQPRGRRRQDVHGRPPEHCDRNRSSHRPQPGHPRGLGDPRRRGPRDDGGHDQGGRRLRPGLAARQARGRLDATKQVQGRRRHDGRRRQRRARLEGSGHRRVHGPRRHRGRQGRVGHDPHRRQLLLHRQGRPQGPRHLRGHPEVRLVHHVRALRGGLADLLMRGDRAPHHARAAPDPLPRPRDGPAAGHRAGRRARGAQHHGQEAAAQGAARRHAVDVALHHRQRVGHDRRHHVYLRSRARRLRGRVHAGAHQAESQLARPEQVPRLAQQLLLVQDVQAHGQRRERRQDEGVRQLLDPQGADGRVHRARLGREFARVLGPVVHAAHLGQHVPEHGDE